MSMLTLDMLVSNLVHDNGMEPGKLSKSMQVFSLGDGPEGFVTGDNPQGVFVRCLNFLL